MLLGFDIGGTKCAVILGKDENEALQIIDKNVTPTNKPVYEMIEHLFRILQEYYNHHFIGARRDLPLQDA